MLIPGRHEASSSYRYGFQGQEKDDEIKGEGNSLNYTFRMHDPRVGRFFAVDPLFKEYPYLSTYQFASNNVIAKIEIEGKEGGWIIGEQYEVTYHPSGPVVGFDNEDIARVAASMHVKSPSELDDQLRSYMDIIARAPKSPPPIAELSDNGLWSQASKMDPHMMLGKSIGHGVGIGVVEVTTDAICAGIFEKGVLLLKYFKKSKTALRSIENTTELAVDTKKKSQVGDVGSYSDNLAKGSVGDNLTPDHIPSFAAVKYMVESVVGKLSPSQARELKKATTTLVIKDEMHKLWSRTFAGKNTIPKIKDDALDLRKAAQSDLDEMRAPLKADGFNDLEIDKMFQEVHRSNENFFKQYNIDY